MNVAGTPQALGSPLPSTWVSQRLEAVIHLSRFVRVV